MSLDEDGGDLAGRRPGESVRQRAREEDERFRRRAPVARLIARVFDVHTDERAWRVGAGGEEHVGARLERLVPLGWRVLHSIPVGENGTDIDHLLIGPGGVFTINTKTHIGKKVWLAERALLVSGQKTSYLPKARAEARRAGRLLEAACGRAVEVAPVLVIRTGAFGDGIQVKSRPHDVTVLDDMAVVRHFKRLPGRLEAREVEELFAVARREATWRAR